MARTRRWGGGGRRRVGRATAGALGVAVLLGLLWLATTEDVRVWPARNTLQYKAVTWWWARAGGPPGEATGDAPGVSRGALRGVVRDAQGRPVAGARVLVTQWDGTTYDAPGGGDGSYAIVGLPAGRYIPVAGAAGYADTALGTPWLPWTQVHVPPGGVARADAVLSAEGMRPATPGTALVVGDPQGLECVTPLPSRATRRRIAFSSAGRDNQLTFLYTPPLPSPAAPAGDGAARAAGAAGGWPLLLTVYPGPADGWECASLPLAAAGYAVLAVGPAYSFELERDVDELARLLGFARAGALPDVDGTRVAVLGGSYSALHVQRLLRRRDAGEVRATVLLGAPSDLFDVRRRFEDGTFVPPFGLDQALIALGFPDREPLRYWRYSGAFHVRADLPPTALIHSRRDEVVPFQQSEALARRLAEAGAPYQLHVFDAAGHYLLSEDADSREIYDLTVAFLERHLSPN